MDVNKKKVNKNTVCGRRRPSDAALEPFLLHDQAMACLNVCTGQLIHGRAICSRQLLSRWFDPSRMTVAAQHHYPASSTSVSMHAG